MGANVNKNGVIDCSPIENYNVASILQDDINVGENLLKNTYFTSDISAYCTVDNARTFQGLPSVKISQSGNESNVYRGYSQTLTQLQPGDTVTASVWIYREAGSTFDGGFEIRLYQYHNDGTTNWSGFSPSLSNWPVDTWIQVKKTYILDPNLNSPVFSLNIVKNGTYWFAAPKVEYGSIATPWSPAPSDNMGPTLSTIINPIELNTFYEI